jgi:hypothetical protein
MKNKELLISIFIILIIFLAGFIVGRLYNKDANPVPIIIEKNSN